MVARGVDFGISSGDMSGDVNYANQIERCLMGPCNGIFGKVKPYYLAWGNHDDDYGHIDDIRPYFDMPGDDKGFYFYHGNVLFIFAHWNGYGVAANLAATRTWLASVLATPEARTAKFRILVQHAPMYLEVWGDNLSDGLLQTAIDGGVDVVFSGHMHGYERIERGGIIQLTNGGLGYLDHVEHVVNNYGSDTKVGGHLNTPYLWARQSSSGVLGTSAPVRMGCITSYGELKVADNKLTYLAHGFNADGSYIGVFDTFAITSKTVSASSPAPQSPAPCANPDAFGAVTNSPCTKALWAQYKTAIGEAYTYTGEGTDPVTDISKTEIEAFCAWLNGNRASGLYRIPMAVELAADNTVSLWASDTYSDTGWMKTVGTPTVDGTDISAIATADCTANYLGFRLTTDVLPQENTWISEPSLSKTTAYADDTIAISIGEAQNGTATLAIDGEAFSGTIISTASLAPGKHTFTATIPRHDGWSQLVKEIEFTVEPDTLVSHYTFDDADNLLNASVGVDGLIFQGRGTAAPISGLGQCLAISGEGRTDGTGAIKSASLLIKSTKACCYARFTAMRTEETHSQRGRTRYASNCFQKVSRHASAIPRPGAGRSMRVSS